MTVPRAKVGLATASVYPESGAAAFEGGMPHLDLEGPIAQRVGSTEEFDEILVAQMIVEPRGIGLDAVAAAAG